MCSVTYHESTTCGHHWVTLRSACHQFSTTSGTTKTKTEPGFNTCPNLRHTNYKLRTQNVTKYVFTSSNSSSPREGDGGDNECPLCIKKGVYDRNECRIVKDTEYRVGFGCGPVDGRTGDVGMPCVVL